MASSNVKEKTNTRTQPRQEVTRVQYVSKAKSDFMRQHLEQNIGSFISVYGRIGALLRLVSANASLSSMVQDWAHYNALIAESTFSDIEKELENIELMGMEDDGIEMTLTRPEPQEFTWNVNHASFTTLIKMIIKLDDFLTRAETIYYKGMMTDNQHQSLTRQIQHLMTTYLERILKATSPGKRVDNENARYNNKQLLAHIRDGGYRLEFQSLSAEHQEIVSEYNQRYSKLKSLSEERERAREKKAKQSETNSTVYTSAEPVKTKAKTSKKTGKTKAEQASDADTPNSEKELDAVEGES